MKKNALLLAWAWTKLSFVVAVSFPVFSVSHAANFDRAPDTTITTKTLFDLPKDFFGANDKVSVYSPKLGSLKHSLSISAQYLSLGYQAFMLGFKNLRLDHTMNGKWTASQK